MDVGGGGPRGGLRGAGSGRMRARARVWAGGSGPGARDAIVTKAGTTVIRRERCGDSRRPRCIDDRSKPLRRPNASRGRRYRSYGGRSTVIEMQKWVLRRLQDLHRHVDTGLTASERPLSTCGYRSYAACETHIDTRIRVAQCPQDLHPDPDSGHAASARPVSTFVQALCGASARSAGVWQGRGEGMRKGVRGSRESSTSAGRGAIRGNDAVATSRGPSCAQ